MHMLQHRAHADAQVERIRLDTLLREHGVLVRVLGKAQTRTTRLLTEKSSELEKLTTQVMQARAESIGKDSVTAFLQADLEALRTRVPDLESRSRLREQINHLSQRNASLVAQMAELQGKLARQNKERVASEARESDVEPQVPCVTHPVTLHLKQRNILCVGGRGGNVATYRELIERVGRRFSHHDGGLEDSPSLLGVRLAAADIVIC